MNARICQKCGKCCISNIGPFIFPEDVSKICNFVRIDPIDFLLQWCDENVIKVKKRKIQIYSLKMKDGKCPFLNNNNLCEIFECRPYQCINAPFNFLSKYSFWSHMPCVKREDFINLNSSNGDKEIFSELLNSGYKKYFERR